MTRSGRQMGRHFRIGAGGHVGLVPDFFFFFESAEKYLFSKKVVPDFICE